MWDPTQPDLSTRLESHYQLTACEGRDTPTAKGVALHVVGFPTADKKVNAF